MKNKKLVIILFLTAVTSLTYKCYCQQSQYDISGSWTATKGELISSRVNGQTEIKEVDINELRFLFDKRKLKINRVFYRYSEDSIYNYAFIDTIPRNHQYRNKIRIKFFDRNEIVLEMSYIGYVRADRVMWYAIYLKKD